ncbi:methylesterase 17-like protein [Cinnamomum micranthum f. kanehirae]|uniref:Methylesterase 17-like protein n=1 Tax=Cinnamomum micranthum f. kanehirae TaxID=337451 RepID=A0A443NPR8_9MAGN|nr:methylesterase 17-like protein [Cinnamomum micranthum f. kanehirae]
MNTHDLSPLQPISRPHLNVDGGRERGQASHLTSSSFMAQCGTGAWCWYKIRSLLGSAGHKVSCLDLKGAGIDRTDTNTIYKFDEYNQPLINFMSHLPDDEKARLSTFKSIWVSILD